MENFFWHKLKRLKLEVFFSVSTLLLFFSSFHSSNTLFSIRCVCRRLQSAIDGAGYAYAYTLTFRLLPVATADATVAGNLCVGRKILRLFYLWLKDKKLGAKYARTDGDTRA